MKSRPTFSGRAAWKGSRTVEDEDPAEYLRQPQRVLHLLPWAPGLNDLGEGVEESPSALPTEMVHRVRFLPAPKNLRQKRRRQRVGD